MPAATAIFGFVALLALVSSAVAAWLVARFTGRISALERQTQSLAEESRQLHLKLEAAQFLAAEAPLYSIPATVDTGMNLSKRVQIIRLHRRGESAPHMASVLNIPLAQVELVLKLQRQASEPSPSAVAEGVLSN